MKRVHVSRAHLFQPSTFRVDSSSSQAVAHAGWLLPLCLAVPGIAFGTGGTDTGGTDSADAGLAQGGGTDWAEAELDKSSIRAKSAGGS